VTTAAERLREVIEHADRHALVELLAPLDEETRAGLAPIADGAFADAKRGHDELLYGHVPDSKDLAEANHWFERMKTAALAWLGTGDIAEFPPPRELSDPQWYERFDFMRAFDFEELHRILLDRRPPWLAELAAQYVTDYHWDAAWKLVIDGALPRPTGEGYLLGMAEYVAWRRLEPGLAEMVLRDPALLTVDLPALLELPDGLARIVRRDLVVDASAGRHTWLPVLHAHFPPGHPIRDRILDQLLDLLAGDLSGPDAARLHKFLDKLAATPGELAARRRALFTLIAHRAPGVVSYAIRILARLGRANLIPPGELIDAVEPALLAPAKSTATAALAIVAAALRRDPRAQRQAVERFATAVAHPHAEVQLAAIEAVAPHLVAHPDIAAHLGELLHDLSATAAQRLRATLPQPTAEPPAPAADLDDVIRRAEKFPPEVARTCGLDVAVEAVRLGGEPPAVQVRPWVAAGAAAIRPVSSVDELIRVLLRVVDGRGGIVDFERALDGLASVGPQWPSDFGRRLGPLLARVNQRFERDAPDWGEQPSGDMCLLVATWIEPERGAGPDYPAAKPGTWLTGRIREVALGLGDADPLPLLALPTDERGWIEPAVLVKRAAASGGAIKRPIDAAVALARLTPSGRTGALHQATDLPGALGRAVRAALGGDDDQSGLPAVVAGVIRWLRGDAHEGPPYLFGAVERDEAPRRTSQELAIDVNLQLQGKPVVNADGEVAMELIQLPAYQEMRAAYAYECAQRFAPDWAATLWPSDHRWLWRDDATTGAGLRLLLDPDEPVPPEALVAAIRQVSRRKPEERTLAVDILIQTIGDARVTSTELARALLTTVEGATTVSSARLVTLLQETAAASALHRATVRASLIDMLPTWLGRLSGQHRYGPVALLDEVCATDGTPITHPKTRAPLKILATGRSKSATIARRLLDRSPPAKHVRSNTSAWPADALTDALTARIERAPVGGR
jgi:hypothetical protein